MGVLGRERSVSHNLYYALMLCILSVVFPACDDSPPPQENQPTPALMKTRFWPEARAARGTSSSSAEGTIVSSGGVGDGNWAQSSDGHFLAHVGSPGEGNVLRVWNVRQGSWSRQVALPFAPMGPLAFSRDGRFIAMAMEGGSVWILNPSGSFGSLPPGPCLRPSHILGIPEGGWVVVGDRGCVSRYRKGEWVQGPNTGVNRALDVAPLTKGEPVIAGLNETAKPVAAIWWPDGVVKSFVDADTTEVKSPKKEGVGSGDIITLALPRSSGAPGWATVSPTLVGAVYVAMEGVPLVGYDPSSGEPISLTMPKKGPWFPSLGIVVSPDSSYFYALKADGTLLGGSTALWEAAWKTKIPSVSSRMGFMSGAGPFLVIQGESIQVLDVSKWSALPGPSSLSERPWQPLELAFANNGKALAVSYASPSVGGTSRWISLWGFEGKNPRRVALGTLKHPGDWPSFLEKNRPSSPVAANPQGTRFAVQGPTGIQLFETSTGVRAGRVTVKDGMALTFAGEEDSLLVARTSGHISTFTVNPDGSVVETADMEGEAPPFLIERAPGRYVVGIMRHENGGALLSIVNSKNKKLGEMAVEGEPRMFAFSPKGKRAMVALPERGLMRWPGGVMAVRAEDEHDRFTAVAYHPRTEELTFAGRDRSLWRRAPGGRPKRMGSASGDVLDLAYHPLGQCVAVALGSGRIEIWGASGPALSIELWEGGRWVAWTSDGEAVGSKSLVESLRLIEANDLTKPVVASTDAIPMAIQKICGR